MKKILLSLSLIIFAFLHAQSQVTYTVTKISDPDPYQHPYFFDDSLCDPDMLGTLQWAVRKCMDTPAATSIAFNIPGNGPHYIDLQYSLQALAKRPVFIDGSTQPGYISGSPQIILDGHDKLTTGLNFTDAVNSGVRGVAFTGFSSQAVVFNYSDHFIIDECFFYRNGLSSSKIEPAAIRIIKCNYGMITGNRIGFAPDGSAPGNSAHGIVLTSTSNYNTIGSQNPDDANVITRSLKYGVWITGSSTSNRITRNLIYDQPNAIMLDSYGNHNKQKPELVQYDPTTGNLSGVAEANDTIEIFGSDAHENANVYLGSSVADQTGHWTVPHSYSTYNYFCGTATDQDHNTSILSDQFINPYPIKVDFTINPDTSSALSPVVFTNTSTIVDTNYHYFIWRFECIDGFVSTDTFVFSDTVYNYNDRIRTYRYQGQYSVSLFLYDNSNQLMDSVTKTVTIIPKDVEYGECLCKRNPCEFIGNGDFADHASPVCMHGQLQATEVYCWNKHYDEDFDICAPMDDYCPIVQGSSDYFNEDFYPTCDGAEYSLSIPSNFMGFSYSSSVDVPTGAYSGIFTYSTIEYNINSGSYISRDYKEYAEQEFSPNLKQGEDYILTFRYRLADHAAYASSLGFVLANDYDCQGVFTSPQGLEAGATYNIPANAQYFYISPDINDGVLYDADLLQKNDWGQFTVQFTANQNYTWIIIGNFWEWNTKAIPVDLNNPQFIQTNSLGTRSKNAYYYLDDVSLTPIFPDIAANPDSICVGQCTTLDASETYDQYWWSVPPDPTLIGQEHNEIITVCPLETTVYHLMYANACTATEEVVVLPSPEKPEICSEPFHNCVPNAHYYLYNPDPNMMYTWEFPAGNGNFVGWTTAPNQISGIGLTQVDVVWTDPFNQPHIELVVTALLNNGCYSSDTLIVFQCCHAPGDAQYVWTDQTFIPSQNLTGQDIYINGTIHLEGGGNFDNCRFLMGPNSKIYLGDDFSPNPVITIIENASQLRSCDNIHMWDGVFILNNKARLTMTGSLARDAKNAIVSMNGGFFNIRSNRFNYNWKSLLVKSNSVSNAASIFMSNKVLCSDINEMLFPYNSLRSYVGVEIDTNKLVKIGNKNQFDNQSIGVKVYKSNARIWDNEFSNMQLTLPQYVKSAIWVVGGRPNILTRIEGNSFSVCDQGVQLEGETDADIVGNYFSNIDKNGIYYTNLKGNVVNIRDNDFVNAQNGIFAYMPKHSTSVISMNRFNWTNNMGFYGIRFFGTNDLNEKLTIGLLNDFNAVKSKKAIWVMNTEKPLIDNNIFKVKNQNYIPYYSYPKAVHLQDCAGALVVNNSITAIGNPTLSSSSYGIQFELSENTTILCNRIEKTGFAIQAVSNCDASYVYNNRMKLCYYGITLSYNGIIGNQGSLTYPSDNTWQNVTESFWSFNSPGVSSQFFVRAINSNYNPPPPDPPGYTGVATAITKNSNAQGAYRPCSITPDPYPHLNNLQQIAQYQYPYYFNDSTEVFISNRSLRKIIRYNFTFQIDPVLNTYYTNTTIQNPGILDTLLWLMRDEQYNSAYTLNELIQPSNNIEENERLVNRIELRHLTSGSDYTVTEIQELRSLAVSCPFTEGTAVYRARNLLVEVDSFNTEYFNDCEMLNDPGLKAMSNLVNDEGAGATEFILYPNPTTGSLTLSVINANPDKQYYLDIYNLLGQRIISSPIPPGIQEFPIDLRKLENAVYLYIIHDSQTELQHGKIVLYKD